MLNFLLLYSFLNLSLCKLMISVFLNLIIGQWSHFIPPENDTNRVSFVSIFLLYLVMIQPKNVNGSIILTVE